MAQMTNREALELLSTIDQLTGLLRTHVEGGDSGCEHPAESRKYLTFGDQGPWQCRQCSHAFDAAGKDLGPQSLDDEG